jgi:hypothetical protein
VLVDVASRRTAPLWLPHQPGAWALRPVNVGVVEAVGLIALVVVLAIPLGSTRL